MSTAQQSALDLKRNVADSYTKTQVDSANSTQDSAIALNTQKVSYTDAATVSNHATQHAQHTAALALKSTIDDPAFTTKITVPLVHTSHMMSQNAHMKIGSEHTNDLNIFLNNAETLQMTRSGTEVRYQAHGGTGQHRFMNKVYGNSDVDISGDYLKSGTNIFASCALTGSPTAPTQSQGDDSTKIATTSYVDEAAGGGGGETATFLYQNSDSTATSSFAGVWISAGDTSTSKQLTASDTTVIVVSEASTNDNFSLILPLLSTCTMGTRYRVRNNSTKTLYLFSHGSESYSFFVKGYTGTIGSTDRLTSPITINTSWRQVDLWAYRDSGNGTYRWLIKNFSY